MTSLSPLTFPQLLCERLELGRKGGGETMADRESFEGGLSDLIDFDECWERVRTKEGLQLFP